MRANWILILTVSAALVGCGKSGTGGGYSTGQSSAAGSTNAGSTAFPSNNNNSNSNTNNNTPAPRAPAPAPSTPAPAPAPAAAAPTVSQIMPNNGDLAGGTTVMVMGTGLDTVTDVQIGGVSLTNLVVTPTEIQGVTGAAAQTGVADVVVFSPNGNATLAGAYTYNAPAPPPPAAPSITYTANIASSIKNSGCLACHAGSFPSGGIDLSNYAGVMQVVTPNDSANSLIVTTQQPGGKMAAQGTVMSSADQATLAQWIDAGAPQ